MSISFDFFIMSLQKHESKRQKTEHHKSKSKSRTKDGSRGRQLAHCRTLPVTTPVTTPMTKDNVRTVGARIVVYTSHLITVCVILILHMYPVNSNDIAKLITDENWVFKST